MSPLLIIGLLAALWIALFLLGLALCLAVHRAERPSLNRSGRR